MNTNITNLKLCKRDFNDQETSHKIEEILQYENLTACTLYKFFIEKNDIQTINLATNLKFLNFDFCYFNMEEILFDSKIETIILNLCENVKIEHLKHTKAKKIKIHHYKNSNIELDLSEFGYAENLEELAIHDCCVKGIEKILEKAPNLKTLNLDGCTVNNPNILLDLKNKIFVSNEKYFYLTSKL